MPSVTSTYVQKHLFQKGKKENRELGEDCGCGFQPQGQNLLRCFPQASPVGVTGCLQLQGQRGNGHKWHKEYSSVK